MDYLALRTNFWKVRDQQLKSGFLTVETLGAVKSAGYRMYGNCLCGKGGQLDLDKLIERYGPEHVFVKDTEVSSKLRCRHCGRKCGALALIPYSDRNDGNTPFR